MAYTDSAIGYAVAVLSDPPPNSDSAIGYDVVTLTDPGPQFSDSAIGFAVVSLHDPVVSSDSAIGYVVVQVGYPHRPAAVLMADGSVRYVPARTWDGTKLR